MTETELKIIKALKKLKKDYGVVEIKAEFETEGSRMNELMRLKEIINKAGLGLVIKIGGAEAVTNMFEAKHLGVTGLVAPMIETSYAMKKYLEAIKKHFSNDVRKHIHFGVNIETYHAYKNLDDILKLPMINLIDTITVGRTDMCGSMGLGKNEINCDQIYQIAEDIFKKAKKGGFRTTMGGGVSPDSVPFIKKLAKKKLLDRFETRKVVFKVSENFDEIEHGINYALNLELLWLENKKNYYFDLFHEDDTRLEVLKQRFGK